MLSHGPLPHRHERAGSSPVGPANIGALMRRDFCGSAKREHDPHKVRKDRRRSYRGFSRRAISFQISSRSSCSPAQPGTASSRPSVARAARA